MIFNSKMDILIEVPDNKVIIYLFKRVMESYDRNKSSKLYISNLNMDVLYSTNFRLKSKIFRNTSRNSGKS